MSVFEEKKQIFQEDFSEDFSEFEHKTNAKVKDLSTMRIEGFAKIVIYPKNVQELKKIIKKCEKNHLKMLILGNGSNILFSEYFDGALIKLKYFDFFKVIRKPYLSKNKLKKIKYKNKFYLIKIIKKIKNRKKIREKWSKKCKKYAKNTFLIKIGAGTNLFLLNRKLKNIGASGLEWSYGIPASLGGFLRMNGGCFGHEICELVQEVQVFQNGKIKWLKNVYFSYRNSSLKNCIILGAKLQFFPKNSKTIEKTMQNYLKKKRETQPCDLPSLGSVFKKCGNIAVSKKIDELGLKGFSIGGAQVSTLHAGFIVNTGGATSMDVKILISFLQKKLLSVGIEAEPEIIFA